MVGGLASPLSYVLIELVSLCQKGDPFRHYHGVGNRMLYCSRKLSPLLQLFNKLGKWFRGVIRPHHLHHIVFQVNFVYRTVSC